MEKRLYSIRGAVCAQNTKDSILENVGTMCRQLFRENKLLSKDLVNIQFSMTEDLDEMNPATALRRFDTGLDTSKVALFCSKEPFVKGMLPFTIRVMVTAYMPEGSDTVPVYLNGAEALRPDFKRS